jgi:hypothetical protein
MMNQRRSAKVAALCGAAVLAASVFARLAGSGPAVLQTTAALEIPVAVPISHRAAPFSADGESVTTASVPAAADAALVNVELAKAAEPQTVAAIPVMAMSEEPNVAATSGQPNIAAAQVGPDTAPPAEPKLILQASLSDPSEIPELPPVPVASAISSGGPPAAVRNVLNSVEIFDECMVADACIDRYLWALYQRTLKMDSIKVHERKKVTVKRKGKMVTVTRNVTRLVDEDFTWKDPNAAEKAGMSMMDYVIGGMDRNFKTKLFHTLRAAEQAGMSPGITSAFRDDYRQSIASGMKAATGRSYHGGSTRGGYGHGLAADVVSVDGATRAHRWVSTEMLWKWIDAHGKEFGIGRPYLGRDPPHVAPTDGKEYAAHNGGMRARNEADTGKRKRLSMREDRAAAKPLKKRNAAEAGSPVRNTRQGAISARPVMAMAEPGRG